LKFKIENIKQLKDVVDCIKNSNKKIVLLTGPLGSGKTTLIKEFVKSLGINKEVTSPTFTIENRYDNVYHYDLYQKYDEFLELGLIENLEDENWHFIEWGEKIEDILEKLGIEYLKVKIVLDNQKRIYECL
jgi:tRNA threonylcarbamoyladenosine biosynthesis protein TsaE